MSSNESKSGKCCGGNHGKHAATEETKRNMYDFPLPGVNIVVTTATPDKFVKVYGCVKVFLMGPYTWFVCNDKEGDVVVKSDEVLLFQVLSEYESSSYLAK